MRLILTKNIQPSSKTCPAADFLSQYKDRRDDESGVMGTKEDDDVSPRGEMEEVVEFVLYA